MQRVPRAHHRALDRAPLTLLTPRISASTPSLHAQGALSNLSERGGEGAGGGGGLVGPFTILPAVTRTLSNMICK